MEYQSKIIINAPCEQVFNAISNVDLFPIFDPSCLKIEGSIKQKQNIKIYTRDRPQRPLMMRVSVVEKNQKMVWSTGLPFGLFRRVRSFIVFAKDDHTTEFLIAEVYSGPLLGLLKNTISDMSKEQKLFTKGLKKYLESR